MKKKKLQVFAFLLTIGMFVSTLSFTVQARASLYLNYYTAFMSSNGNGSVSVNFDVIGTGTMDEVGTLTILVKDSSGAVVATFKYATTPGMLAKNKAANGGSVTYKGTSGATYYAVVTVWAGKGGEGDSRDITTLSIKA